MTPVTGVVLQPPAQQARPTPAQPGLPTPARAGWRGPALASVLPSVLEALLLVAVIAALWPAFERIAGFGTGRAQRFATQGIEVAGLPPPALPAVCAAVGAAADAVLQERLCGAAVSRHATPATLAVAPPPALQQAVERTLRAFAAPVADAQARLNRLRQQQQEGIGELRAVADAIAAIEAELQPYLERFALERGELAGPLPLHCAWSWLVAGQALPDSAQNDGAARGNALLLFAAALDGRTLGAALASPARLPARLPAGPLASGACPAAGDAALAATATLMADARQSLSRAQKNEAMQALLRSAGWQWAGAMALGYGLLLWSRRSPSPAAGVGVSLLAWAVAAWLARVPWPLAGARAFEPARLELGAFGRPAGFVLVLIAAGLGLLALAGWRRGGAAGSTRASPTQAMSSRLGYGGLALATGLGWVLLLELSAQGHPVNRYLALYHQGHLWLGLLVFSLLLFVRQPLARGLARGLWIVGEQARRARARLGAGLSFALLGLLALAALAGVGALLTNMRQLTSELGRIWLIVGAAWFFFLRAGPMTMRLAAPGAVAAPIIRYAWPLLFIVGLLVGAMIVTHDMGPLLIAGYGAGAFVAAAVAMGWHQRGASALAAFALALGLFVAWIVAVTAALFQLGAVDAVTAARLESLAAPLASTNDQLALVSWFQRAAPPQGFGLGAVPWCGHAPAAQCSGVPAQVHSDYTFTAIVGVYGAAAAWAAALGSALWLHRLIRHHGRVTRGEPRLLATAAGRLAHDGQALLSWIAVGWVVLTTCQLAVTVAGNLAVLPLTGVTFPFVSFGMTSLAVNLAFLALCLNVDVPPERHHG